MAKLYFSVVVLYIFTTTFVHNCLPAQLNSLDLQNVNSIQDEGGAGLSVHQAASSGSDGVTAKLVDTNPDDILFALYNDKSDNGTYEVLQFKNLTSITSSKFYPNKITKILTHGYNSNFKGIFPQRTKDAYLSTSQDYNIIAVDWGKLSTPVPSILYPLAVSNVHTAGVRIGEFISWLRNESLIDLDNVHLVGHSLGSHVSGIAASTVQKQSNNQSIARLSGLDPAGPEFYTGILARTLSPQDANFVDVYHTTAGTLGIWKNVGTVDYYMNGGSGPQPGCSPEVLSCSHSWAHQFFTNTIGTGVLRQQDEQLCACNDLLGYQLRTCSCDKRVTVGEYTPTSSSGQSYLDYRFKLE